MGCDRGFATAPNTGTPTRGAMGAPRSEPAKNRVGCGRAVVALDLDPDVPGRSLRPAPESLDR